MVVTGAGCASGKAGRSKGADQQSHVTASAEALEYLRSFSREQQEHLGAMHDSRPVWGAHGEAIEYADFLDQKGPEVLRIVEQRLPAEQRGPYRRAQARVEAAIAKEQRQIEEEAADNEGGTLAKLIRHEGRRMPMRHRLSALSQWIAFLPPELQPELRSICARTAKD